ncbi:hypothetical protein [Rufibacter quisquiliarum]|uniref:Lipoprotein n=1 Tax=Rufibacter quisquiliarum TaxID=1549639 RepID=A0A839GLR2_9BACT|nr:hypothetical protein [Rufibacter quisquiliarum]MBA9075877.1 hypothetical protein [Rufibacter quisquiliarum]
MEYKNIRTVFFAFWVVALGWLAGCKTANAPADANAEAATVQYKSMAPQRVDIRGSIFQSRYDQGQVMLEVEGFGSTPDSRYNRAYVLVLPTTQIVDPEGKTISLSELRQGQDVAIVLRGGGRGNFVGVGVARKVWLEQRL